MGVKNNIAENLPIEEMIGQALLVRERAYAPYSHFQVGAALLTRELRIYTGCNVENAAYGSSICAERCAMLKAVSEGSRKWKAIVIAGGSEGSEPDTYAYPCGACRQFMQEFVDPEEFLVIIAKSKTDYKTYLFKEIFPEGFGKEALS